MIDMHTHVLPGMDDGSKSLEESLELLRLSYGQGVRELIASSHFYASHNTPREFLARRREAWERLRPCLTAEMPKIYLGAEVYYFSGIARSREIEPLCISGTKVLLLEMPFRKWSSSMVYEVRQLAENRDFTVLLAHIDRYLSSQPAETWEALEDAGVLFQANASAFLEGWLFKRRMEKLLRNGRIAVLGSDCHNLENRCPNLAEAMRAIVKDCGREAAAMLTDNAGRLLRPQG